MKITLVVSMFLILSFGLHLDVKGCQVWANALKPIFKKRLGAPAEEDFAPPLPTADPSAAKK